MSVAEYTIFAVECDIPDCFETAEGLPGESVDDVLRQAQERGWVRDRLLADRCPKHAAGGTDGD